MQRKGGCGDTRRPPPRQSIVAANGVLLADGYVLATTSPTKIPSTLSDLRRTNPAIKFGSISNIHTASTAERGSLTNTEPGMWFLPSCEPPVLLNTAPKDYFLWTACI